jgi:hypothetical protein
MPQPNVLDTFYGQLYLRNFYFLSKIAVESLAYLIKIWLNKQEIRLYRAIKNEKST